MTVYDIVKKLIGDIMPIAETQTDKVRFENLKATTELVDALLFDINRVAYSFKNRHEDSLKRASAFASKFLDEIEITDH